uniref:Uncharacterized protein n=1 Tax=Anguilla anguilla TaxID=7936 RepID=A0A0E9QQR3_ANGAN
MTLEIIRSLIQGTVL